jgi:crossover junction endodeoxyribonuclease RuvC
VRVLGIDPGSNATGWGIVRLERGRYHFEGAGVVRTDASDAMGARLSAIHGGLFEVLRATTPDEVAIEAIFHHRSAESALRLGQARGVALLAAAQAGYEASAYNPMVVKQTVGAHGRADKRGVARMVGMLLGAKLDLPADATDALAIAITHLAHARTRVPRATGGGR